MWTVIATLAPLILAGIVAFASSGRDRERHDLVAELKLVASVPEGVPARAKMLDHLDRRLKAYLFVEVREQRQRAQRTQSKWWLGRRIAGYIVVTIGLTAGSAAITRHYTQATHRTWVEWAGFGVTVMVGFVLYQGVARYTSKLVYSMAYESAHLELEVEEHKIALAELEAQLDETQKQIDRLEDEIAALNDAPG